MYVSFFKLFYVGVITIPLSLPTKPVVNNNQNYTAVKPDSTALLVSAVNHLKSYEGFRANVYIDVDGSPTVGYGHHLLPSDTFRVVSERFATTLLLEDLKKRIEYVRKLYTTDYKKSIALALFSFNCGTGNLNKLVKKGVLTTPKIILKYCHYTKRNKDGTKTIIKSNKLFKRREYEYSLLKS